MSLRLCHPGKFGDLLWALPTARALAEQAGKDEEYGGVELHLPSALRSIKPLLEKQGDYLASVVLHDDWQVQDTAPATPLQPPGYTMPSLGYKQWPVRELPYEVAWEHGMYESGLSDAHFFRPWIHVLPLDYNLASDRQRLVVHWTDRWFELKLGILRELQRVLARDVYCQWIAAPGSRMAEAGAVQVDWVALARTLAGADAVLTDCSSAHVLAAAVGVKTILVVEPETDRHHFIFWPGSTDTWQPRDTVLGRAIRPVLGNDGKPTFDSRHTIEEVTRALRR
jgi:hypothetical protein